MIICAKTGRMKEHGKPCRCRKANERDSDRRKGRAPSARERHDRMWVIERGAPEGRDVRPTAEGSPPFNMLKKGGGPMQEMLFEVLNAIATAAIATFVWWLIYTKRNDHDEQDRDR